MLQRILLIEDSEGEALLVKQRLRKAGFEDPLYHISQGREALEYLQGVGRYTDRRHFPLPEIILLDLGMPEVDGYQILRWIRQQRHLTRMVVVVLTGEMDPKNIALAYQLGASSYLSKQGSDEEFENFVEYFKSYSEIASAAPLMVEDTLPVLDVFGVRVNPDSAAGSSPQRRAAS